MKKFVILSLCIIIFMCHGCGKDTDNNIKSDISTETSINKAETYISVGNYSSAKILFETVLKQEPSNSKANFMLAILDIIYLIENNNVKAMYKRFGADDDVVNSFTFNKLIEDDYANKKSSIPKFTSKLPADLMKSFLDASPNERKEGKTVFTSKRLSTMFRQTASSISRASRYPGVNYPTIAEIKTLISGTIIPVLKSSVTRLEIIENKSDFSYPIKKSWFPIDDPSTPSTLMTISKGHVYILHAYLDYIISQFYILLGYNLDIGEFEYYETLSDTTESDFLYPYWLVYKKLFIDDTDFFTVENQKYFTYAQEYYVSFLGNIILSIKNIELNDTIGNVLFDDDFKEILNDKNADFYISLIEEVGNDLIASHLGTKVFTIIDYDFFPPKDDGFSLLDDMKNEFIDIFGITDAAKYWDAIRIDFSKQYTDPITRDDLPSLQYDKIIWFKDADESVENFQLFPDPDFNGLFPALTRDLHLPLDGIVSDSAFVTFVNATDTDYYVGMTGYTFNDPISYNLVSSNSTTTVPFNKWLFDYEVLVRFKLSPDSSTVITSEDYMLNSTVILSETAKIKIINSSNKTIYAGTKSYLDNTLDKDLSYSSISAKSTKTITINKTSIFEDDEDINYIILKNSSSYDTENIVKTGRLPDGGTLNYFENIYDVKIINDSSKTVYVAIDNDYYGVVNKAHSILAPGVTATYQITLSAPDKYYYYNVRTINNNEITNHTSGLSVYKTAKIIDNYIRINNYSDTDIYVLREDNCYSSFSNTYSTQSEKVAAATINYKYSIGDGISIVDNSSIHYNYNLDCIYYGYNSSSSIGYFYSFRDINDSISFYGPKSISVQIANCSDTEYYWQLYSQNLSTISNDSFLISANETQTLTAIISLWNKNINLRAKRYYYYFNYGNWYLSSTVYNVENNSLYEYKKRINTLMFDNIKLVNNTNQSFYYDIAAFGNYNFTNSLKVIDSSSTINLSGVYSEEKRYFYLYNTNANNYVSSFTIYIRNTNNSTGYNSSHLLEDNKEYYINLDIYDFTYTYGYGNYRISEKNMPGYYWSDTWWSWMK